MSVTHSAGRTNGERRAFLAAVVRRQEEERRRLATGLHDDAIQVMFGAAFVLEVLARRQGDAELAAATRNVAADLTAAGERLNRLMHDLQPPPAGQTLGQALRRTVRRASAVSGFDGSVEGDLSAAPAPEQFAVAYRLAQEALSSAARHAGASTVRIVVAERDRGALVRVEDDGVGWAAEPCDAGVGAELAGGWWRTETGPPHQGTLVEFWIPLEL
jgi:signal transduction histidine kinase